MTEPKVYRYVLEAEKFTPEARILTCELVRETSLYATLKVPDWHGRTSQYRLKKTGRVFNTWQDAHDELMSRAQRHLDQARLKLQRAQRLHGNIAGMRPRQTKPPPKENHDRTTSRETRLVRELRSTQRIQSIQA